MYLSSKKTIVGDRGERLVSIQLRAGRRGIYGNYMYEALHYLRMLGLAQVLLGSLCPMIICAFESSQFCETQWKR